MACCGIQTPVNKHHNKSRNHDDLDSEVSGLKDPIILRQDAELHEPDRDRVDQLVGIPMFERGHQYLWQI
ncbi:uncharacterized protein DSM5745_04331 [Aspergillus mulundensis]|uniref:Uncharacterized protein n=1 Tax=Aspergillus mulundensis TaxID=1810919 RepID=A0A3D8SCF2_9EURO|nr:hypothetical protein DSM5745_04331 [Aspergillus mulundensis]RDW84005.1 hypothetical protein DSM5745_04331 [Aspergillus mulundensis]